MSKVAFLGLGAMGSRMATRLLAAGHAVTVWNRSAERAGPLVERGAQVAATPAEAAAGAEVVIAMLRDDDASEAVWCDPEGGALAGMADGALAIECGTLTVDWTRRLGEALAERSLRFIDAPLAGSLPQAEAGQLIFFAGGPAANVKAVQPLLLAMGAVVHHAGHAVGSGMAVKLMVNALFGLQVAAVAEVLALGEALGVSAHKGADILGETPVLSPVAKAAAAAMVARAYPPLFPIDLVEKDFGCITATAERAGTAVPLSQAARAVFAQAKAAGYGGDNITGVAQLY